MVFFINSLQALQIEKTPVMLSDNPQTRLPLKLPQSLPQK